MKENCDVNTTSSRICELGTKSCIVRHTTAGRHIDDTGYAGLNDLSTTNTSDEEVIQKGLDKRYGVNDTSDWAERFDKEFFVFKNAAWTEDKKRVLKQFIAKEIERVAEINLKGYDVTNIYKEAFKVGQQAEQSRIIALAEGMKVKVTDCPHDGSSSCDSDCANQSMDIIHNAALDTLITKIQE